MQLFLTELARDAYNPQLRRKGYKTTFFDMDGAQAYLLTNQTHQIVVFRGTDELKDLFSIAKSHEGFVEYANSLLRIPINYKKKLILVGHSLGGAIAVCFASLVKHPDTEIYSFGCPKVGTKAFVEEIKHIPHTRYVTTYDHVPHLPLFSCHHSKQVKLSTKSLFNNHHIDFYIKTMKNLTPLEK
jgi:cephalosporin-C deacetylase-like acetyl esterase